MPPSTRTALRHLLLRWWSLPVRVDLLGIARMPRVIGRHEGPLASALHQTPALIGLEVVVVTAVGIGVLKARGEGLDPVMAVVDLPGQGRTALDRTDRIQ